MKISEFRKLIREEVRKVIKENLTAQDMIDGTGLPYDYGKAARGFVKIANELGMKQGSWNNGVANKDYSFDYERGDAKDSNELVNDKGANGIGKNPSLIFILNPKMQKDSRVKKLLWHCVTTF